jgi:hypothetical protein
MKKRSVRCKINFKPFLVADIQKLIDLGMEQRLAFNVKINIFSMSFDLVQCIRESIDLNEVSLTFRRRAESASKVTYARDFDVKFFECFQGSGAPIVHAIRMMPLL